MISSILLAAGESKRMGQPKQLMPLANSTIVEQAIDNLLNSRVSEVHNLPPPAVGTVRTRT